MRQQGKTSCKRKPWLLGLEDSGLSVSRHSQVRPVPLCPPKQSQPSCRTHSLLLTLTCGPYRSSWLEVGRISQSQKNLQSPSRGDG